ncbi:hypothetical protein IFM89_001827 [Coptis chinensis]|uniref:Uncharacterized protein n=1 Tax=Coptis chinensis TaxID=261450 RepID=A0A835HHP5_9MAGN|nr:hypothetical protein IFM89_001827 [Coptis chinensis]
MRFVAMKLRSEKVSNAQGSEEEIESSLENSETWEPKLKGLLTTWLIVSSFSKLWNALWKNLKMFLVRFLSFCLHLLSILSRYLAELAGKSAPMFLCNFYNIYFAHISNGQVIAKQISGSTWDFIPYGLSLLARKFLRSSWKGERAGVLQMGGDALEFFEGCRDKLNNVGGLGGIRNQRLKKQDTISVQYSGMTELKLWKWTVDMIMTA